MTVLPWNFTSSEAVFLQIADRLRQKILSGAYPMGSQIPSVRTLAFEAAVNPNTMQKALTLLETEGLLYAEGTVGRFVTTDGATLDAARERLRRETVRRLLRDTARLGIPKEELIQLIKEDDTYGITDPVLPCSNEKL